MRDFYFTFFVFFYIMDYGVELDFVECYPIGLTGYGSVWLECTAGGREVAGSNPVTPIFALKWHA